MPRKKHVWTREEIIEKSQSLEGKSLHDLGYTDDRDAEYKGSVGHFIEEEVFQYKVNNRSEPDFLEAGVELKTTPVRKNKDGTYSAKERLVLNMMPYHEDALATFETSSFWRKNAILDIIFYLHKPEEEIRDYEILKSILYEYPEEDLIIIRKDWEDIKKKILEGRAETISEADTLFLGACTKGKNSRAKTSQPYSTVMATKRAYCLKTSYMTYLVRKFIQKEKIPSLELSYFTPQMSFEDKIRNRLSVFFGDSEAVLMARYGLQTNAKSRMYMMLARMLGVSHGKIQDTAEFKKANIEAKTVRIEESGRIEQSMSFPAFNYEELIKEKWETSTLRNYFLTTKLMFVVFKKYEGEFRFENIIFWNMPLNTLDSEVRRIWIMTTRIIKKGRIVNRVTKSGKRVTNFPGMADSSCIHVRPHGLNAGDTCTLPVRDLVTQAGEYTKHCFWLNSSYIKQIISTLAKNENQ